MQSQVPRWRWWIHFLLIDGYFFPGQYRATFALLPLIASKFPELRP
jgi:hypothetical protein